MNRIKKLWIIAGLALIVAVVGAGCHMGTIRSGSTEDKKESVSGRKDQEKKQEGKGVKTGDDTPILPMTMTLAISALAVLLILNKRKKETGEQ